MFSDQVKNSVIFFAVYVLPTQVGHKNITEGTGTERAHGFNSNILSLSESIAQNIESVYFIGSSCHFTK